MPFNRYCPNEFTPEAAARIVCLPHAGGGAAAFHRWRREIPQALELVPLALAGREARIDERPLTRMTSLVAEIADAIAPALDRPYALVGHSMGAWVALELARELRSRGLPLPRMLVVAASAPPHKAKLEAPLHHLPDDEFVAEVVRRFDGIPQAVRENKELLELTLPALRADFELLETYAFTEQPPLATDLLALGGTSDPAVTVAELGQWRQYCTGEILGAEDTRWALLPISKRTFRPVARWSDDRRATPTTAVQSMKLLWPEESQAPPLAAGEAHVWAMSLADVRTPWIELQNMLSAAEQTRAQRFLREEARRSFTAARCGLRLILGMYLGLPPAQVPIETAQNGKPQLVEETTYDLQFNLAHSGELALVAVTCGAEIGVDVERLRPVDHWRDIASRYFHVVESNAIGADAAQTPINFFRCWTRKEAVLKAIGVGIIFPLDLFRVPLEEHTTGWVDVPPHSSNAAPRYWLESLEPCDGYLGAIATAQQLRSTTGFTFRV